MPAGVEPLPVALDERRMQLRAYDLWSRLLGSGRLPAIADLKPGEHPSFSPFGVLLDFTRSRKDPHIAYLGESLARECGVDGTCLTRVSDLPAGSLLARIAEHYLLAIVGPEPVGFEAEFNNQRDKTILCRGILLPFICDRPNIDFVFGVINWKELADEHLIGELLLELCQALGCEPHDPGPVGGGEGGGEGGMIHSLPAIAPDELRAIDAAGGKVAR